jgi:hypothetical protein
MALEVSSIGFGCDDPEHSNFWLKKQIHYLVGERMEIYWEDLRKVEASIEGAMYVASDLRSTAAKALEDSVRTALSFISNILTSSLINSKYAAGRLLQQIECDTYEKMDALTERYRIMANKMRFLEGQFEQARGMWSVFLENLILMFRLR